MKPSYIFLLQGDKIYATCRHNQFMSLGSKCVIGEWKTIENMFAEMLETYSEQAHKGVVVCLLRFAKLGSFKGKIKILRF